MPCYHQQMAVPTGTTKKGKVKFTFKGKARRPDLRYLRFLPTTKLLPCRTCIGCRLEKSRQWATRLMHESSSHEKACFLTLTYDDKHLPKTHSLNRTHYTTFIKDLRSRLKYHAKKEDRKKIKIKYFGCGEYGTQGTRGINPHYHFLVYGAFCGLGTDQGTTPERPSRSGSPQYSHPHLKAVWKKGDAYFSELTFESAAYVARYILKKVTGTYAKDHYGSLLPEFQSGSNGLGKAHVEKWITDIYPADHVVLPGRGAFMPPPYYDRILEKVDPALYDKVKKAREAAQEDLNLDTFTEHVTDSLREETVRTLVTEATLKRSI